MGNDCFLVKNILIFYIIGINSGVNKMNTRIGKCYDIFTHYTYDAKGNLRYEKDSGGFEYWYDVDGHIIHTKNSAGNEQWLEYDVEGNNIHWRCSNGMDSWYEYDANGNLIRSTDAIGYERRHECNAEYDDKGNLIHKKWFDGSEYRHDATENSTYSKTANGIEYWWKNGHMTHVKSPSGREYLYYSNGKCRY